MRCGGNAMASTQKYSTEKVLNGFFKFIQELILKQARKLIGNAKIYLFIDVQLLGTYKYFA